MLGDQQVNRLLREGQRSHGVACFRRTDHQFPVNSIYLFRDSKRPVFNVQVRLLEGQQFTAPQAGGQLQIEGCEKPTALRFCEVHPDFLLRQDLHFPFLELRLFIEKIVVHEKEVKWSKHVPQTVEIYYNGIGFVDSQQQDMASPQPRKTEEPRQAS